MTRIRLAVGGVAVATGLALTGGCTGGSPRATFQDSGVPAGSFQLVKFGSCDDALGRMKQAAKEYVGPYGFGGAGAWGGDLALPGTARREAASAADAGGGAPPTDKRADTPDYSRTNTHEAGVDEPDLVKTDGRRIVTITGGVLHVVDAGSRSVAGRLDLAQTGGDPVRFTGGDLLLHGDRALVLVNDGYFADRGPGMVVDGPVRPDPTRIVGPRLLLVDLAGAPRLLASYTVDGGLVDARQVGPTARVVVRSAPRLMFPYEQQGTDAQRLAANKAVIDKAGPDDWLPRYQVTAGGRTSTARVGCEAVSRPTTYSGTSMLTLLTFDLGAAGLGDGDPLTIVADGDTVYSNGPSLYVATDQRWRALPADARRGGAARLPEERTEIYKFDTSGDGRPRYVASGSVPGYLVNQYALSEWDNHLRVATTTGQASGRDARSSSAVYVLAQRGRGFTETGKVTGLGRGERIYAVRFAGPLGYVVTFRQVDPLYTVDLSKPDAPRVTGELKITGYSAYLHPVGASRLVGIGQEANGQGRVQGTQISLFDVSDLTRPSRIAQYHARYGRSEAEFDPHAFLYWPQTGVLVVPLNVYSPSGGGSEGGALVLKVSEAALTEIGTISHPQARHDGKGGYPGQIRRALMIGDTLWTVSEGGLRADRMPDLGAHTWVPLT